MEKKNARPNELETSAPSEAKFTGTDNPRPLHNLADHPAEARIMLILSRFA